MTIATCSRCSNTGYLGDRFCSCPFAATLRDRIETAPEFAEFRRKRAEVDYTLKRIEEGSPIDVPADAPADVKGRIRAYNALVDNTDAAKHWRAQGCPPGEILPPDNPEVN